MSNVDTLAPMCAPGSLVEGNATCGSELFVGKALINPLPSLGVVWEVRPGLLKAMSSDKRVRLAVAAIKASIEHLQGRGGAARD